MDIRRSVLAALDTTTGVLDRPKFAALALSGGDFALADLDLDSLSAYEVIMATFNKAAGRHGTAGHLLR